MERSTTNECRRKRMVPCGCASVLLGLVGQTLRVINDDGAPHILHSFGVPLEHGDTIPPGGSAEYPLLEPYDVGDGTPELWDHEAGEPAYFWLRVLARD